MKSDVITYLASRVYRVPIITTMHGWIANSPKQRAFTALDKRVARHYNCVIAVSSEIRDELQRAGVPERALRLLHNAIVIDRYQRTGRRGGIAGLAGREVTRPVISSIGRLSAEKGHGDLLEALAIVRATGQRVSAVVAGDGPERPTLMEQARALGLDQTVHFTGHVSEPQRILEETDLMVLPSHTEGLPNAVLEALAMNVPVLATRVGGTPEVISDGETGRLVPPRAPQAMASAILQFLTDPAPWAAMAVRGREMLERRFDFRARTRRLELLYDEVLAGGPA
jgi:glycosyltransferase involved in cell wall biosynthesis